jgi:TRAP-type uncharacterized transport system substrate-binding protein
MKTTPALVLALGLAVTGCDKPPVTLRIVSGLPTVTQDVAALLAGASDAADARVRIVAGATVAGGEAALSALEDGTADLAIVENSASYTHATVRTIAPLYPSVLHIGVRSGRPGQSLREVFDGATVFAGGEQSPARQLLDLMASMYGWSGVEFSYVDSLDSDPDVVFMFAPISPKAAPVLDGYELLSLGRAEDVGAGSVADGLSLVAPFLRPFIIPEGTYAQLTPTAIATVALDALLVTRADTARVVVYDLLHTIQMTGPLLVAQRPDIAVDELETFNISHVTFPVHPGALTFRARNEPGFAERASGIFEVAVTIVAALATGFVALLRYLRGRRKGRIDKFYTEALAIRCKLLEEQDAQQRRVLIAELRTLRDRAFSLLINEKLSADESFRILQGLIGGVIHEFDSPAEQRRATTD